MRRYIGQVMVLGFLALCGAPFVAVAGPTVGSAAETMAVVPMPAERGADTGFRDEAAMVLVGSALIGLAAAVRRAH